MTLDERIEELVVAARIKDTHTEALWREALILLREIETEDGDQLPTRVRKLITFAKIMWMAHRTASPVAIPFLSALKSHLHHLTSR